MGPVSDRATVRVLTQRYQWRRAEGRARVGIIMGSDSDLATMRAAAEALEGLGVPAEVTIVSAHRTPERMVAYARGAHTRGLQARRRPRAAGALSLWRPLFDWDPGWAAPRNNMTGVVAAPWEALCAPTMGCRVECAGALAAQPDLTGEAPMQRQRPGAPASAAAGDARACACACAPVHGRARRRLCLSWTPPLCPLAHPSLLTESSPAVPQVIIAGAGGAAHLPGMVAALTPLPVVGVPVVPPTGAALSGIDALLSIVQARRPTPALSLQRDHVVQTLGCAAWFHEYHRAYPAYFTQAGMTHFTQPARTHDSCDMTSLGALGAAR